MGENLSIFKFSGNLLLTEYIDYLLPLGLVASSVISLQQIAAVYYIHNV